MRWLVVSLAALVACSSAPRIIAPTPPPLAPPPPPVAAPAPAPDPAPPTFRLPGDVKPVKVALDLTIVPTQDRVPGTVHIDATVVTPTRVVWLNASGLDVAQAALGGQPARVIKGGEDFVGLVAAKDLPAGPLAIDVAFTATIDRARAAAGSTPRSRTARPTSTRSSSRSTPAAPSLASTSRTPRSLGC